MQYNHYHSTSHQARPPSHPSPDDYPPPYPDPSHQHAALSYAAVNPATPLPAGSIAHQNISPQYYPYATQGTPDNHRPYYSSSSQGTVIDHYPTANSPTTSYASPTPSSQVNSINSVPSRHHAHLSQSQQHQFIPTPSQAYQVYSSTGPTPSTRSRPAIEPYYHMSPNPQHPAHPHAASTAHGAGGRNNTGPGLLHPHHVQTTHSGTIVVPAGERYLCDRCERTFTRSHDRRRHYETVHSTSPVLHKCRFCRKDFSRSDSLKRHVDNGCDEMPR